MKADSISQMGVIMRPGLKIRRRKIPEDSPQIEQVEKLDEIIATTKIYVKSLEISAQCGVYSHEIGQNRSLFIDIEIDMVAAQMVRSDDLTQTYDYDKLAQIAQDIASSKHFYLIESYAGEVARHILADERIRSVRVRVEKPNSVKSAAAAGTEIFCTRGNQT
jgi:dihydroneopterin aldolase